MSDKLSDTVFKNLRYDEVKEVYEALDSYYKGLARKFPFAFFYAVGVCNHRDYSSKIRGDVEGYDKRLMVLVAWAQAILTKLESSNASRRAVFFYKAKFGDWGEDEADKSEDGLFEFFSDLFSEKVGGINGRPISSGSKPQLKLVVSN